MVKKTEKSLFEYDKHGAGPAPDGEEGWEESFCSICTTAKAPYQCVKCQSKVCSEHFVSIMGLCVECAPVKDAGKAFKMAKPFNPEKTYPEPEPIVQNIATVTVYRGSKDAKNKGKKSDGEEGAGSHEHEEKEETTIDWV